MGGHRIDIEPLLGDQLTTGQAPAKFTLFDPFERGIDPGDIRLAPPRFGIGHRLLLHRVHARQSTDALLIELNRFAPLGRAFILAAQLCAQGQQLRAPFLGTLIIFSHGPIVDPGPAKIKL